MSARNLSLNPSGAIDMHGWSGATRVEGLTGMARPHGGRATRASSSGSITIYSGINSPDGADRSGRSMTILQVCRASASSTWRPLAVCYNAQGSFLQSIGGTATARQANTTWLEIHRLTLPNGTSRVWPGLATTVNVAAGVHITIAGVRMDDVDDPALTYADGDTPSWTWDGGVGASSSRLVVARPGAFWPLAATF